MAEACGFRWQMNWSSQADTARGIGEDKFPSYAIVRILEGLLCLFCLQLSASFIDRIPEEKKKQS